MSFVTRGSSFKSPHLNGPRSDLFYSIFPSGDELNNVQASKSEDEFLLSIDVPGLQKEDLEVQIEKRTLTARGERKKDYSAEKVYQRELSYASFSHEFMIPEDYDLSKTRVELNHGQLLISVPRDPKTRARRIDIKIR